MMYEQQRKRPRICGAAWCTKTSEDSPLFNFPTNEQRAKQWETALVYKTICTTRRSRILCRDHFEDRCFISTLKTQLLSTAIPTLQVKIKEEKISDDEASKSPYSESKLHTSNGVKNRFFLSRATLAENQLKRKYDIEKTLDEYLQKRQLVLNKLKRLEDARSHKPVQNVAPKKNIKKSNKSKKQKTNDVEEIVKLNECDLNLMSCCLMNSIDKKVELEKEVIDKSKLKVFVIQMPKQSENKIKQLESNTPKSDVDSAKTIERTKKDEIGIAKTGNNSSNALSSIESGVINNAKGGVHLSKNLSIITDENVFKVVKGIENSSKSSSVRTENDAFKVVRGVENSSKPSSSKTTKETECLSEISSVAMESSAFKKKLEIANSFKTAKDKIENLSMLLNITSENDGSKNVVNEGLKDCMPEASKVIKIEPENVCTSEISDVDRCDKFKNYMSNKSNSNQSALELQSDSDLHIKQNLSDSAIKVVENSPKTSNNINKHFSNTGIDEPSLAPSRTETSVFRTEEDNVENPISQESDSVETESKDVCILEISEDLASFGVNVANRLKKLEDRFVRIKALMAIQKILLEAEYEVANKK